MSLAREYVHHGFAALRDLDNLDPEFSTVDLRDALDAGLVDGPRLVVAAQVVSASAGRGDVRVPPRRTADCRSRSACASMRFVADGAASDHRVRDDAAGDDGRQHDRASAVPGLSSRTAWIGT